MSNETKTQRITVAAFILRSDGTFLVGERAVDEAFLPGYLELIGGGSKWGENPQDALIREVKEESGLDVEVDAPLMTIMYTMGDVHRVMIVFLCTPIGNDSPKPSAEHSRLFWVSRSELSNYRTDDFMNRVVQESVAHIQRLGITVAE